MSSALGCDFSVRPPASSCAARAGSGSSTSPTGCWTRGAIRCRSTCAARRWSPRALRAGCDARRFENWEFSYALVLGLGAAARYALDVGVDVGGARAGSLAALVRGRLRAIPAPAHRTRRAAVRDRDVRDRRPRSRAACPGAPGTGRQHKLVDKWARPVQQPRAPGTSMLRISPHYYNTEAEVHTALDTIEALVT